MSRGEPLYAPSAETLAGHGYVLIEAADPDDTWTVILDPAAAIDDRVALNINTGPIRVSQDGIDWGQSVIDAYEAELGTWGSTVVDRRWPNRTVTINLLVGADDTGEAGFIEAAKQLRQKVALWQRESGVIQRGSDVPMYAEVVNASLTFADQWGETGFLESNVVLTLECLPDFFGDEIELDTISCTGHCAAVLQQDGEDAIIDGDHPGRVRIVVTNSSGADQHIGYWAFRSRHYDSASTAALFYEAEALTPFSGVSVTGAAGASGGEVLSGSPPASWGNFLQITGTHQGVFRMLARGQATDGSFRLVWGIGDMAHPVINTQADGSGLLPFEIFDLGVINVAAPPIGDYQWTGVIQMQGTTDMSLDCIWLQPLDESAGFLEATTPGPFGAADAVIFADAGLEIRTDGVYRQDDSSGFFNPVASVLGDLPRIPSSGLEGRAVEVFVKPSRQAASIADGGLDAFTVEVRCRPSYLFRP